MNKKNNWGMRSKSRGDIGEHKGERNGDLRGDRSR